MKEIKVLKEIRDLLKRNNRWTFWAFIGTFIGIVIAILMAYLALSQVRTLVIGGSENGEYPPSHLESSPLLGNSSGLSKGVINSIHSDSSPQIVQLAYKIIQCESSWRPDVYGDGGRAYGLAQFHKPTWDWLTGLYGVDLDYYNSQDQIELLLLALQDNRGYLWSCWHQLIN